MNNKVLNLKRPGRRATLCLALSASLLSQSSFGQSFAFNQTRLAQPASERIGSKSLKQALSELENRFHVFFIYESRLVEEKKILLNASTSDQLEESMKSLLTPHDLKFEKVKENVYVIVSSENNERSLNEIKPNSQLLTEPTADLGVNLLHTSILARMEYVPVHSNRVADIQVKGKVTSEDGEPLPGVSVLVKGTSTGTATSADGTYQLTVPETATLVFSFIGYTSEEVAVNNQTTINVSLQPDIKALSEVVVVAYGTQKRTSVTGAISSVSSKDIVALPVPSVEQSIQGRVPGILVINNGQPGDAPLVRMRGISSINYASGPLYVVDGIPQVGNFNIFDSRDIESVEVLKDANSAALYGSRATAGVILITTKKGSRDGKMHVNLESYYGVQTAWKQLDLLNTAQYVQYGTALLNNAGQSLPPRFGALNEPIYAGSSQTYAQTNTDWQDEMFRTAPITHNSLSLHGGNDKSRFYASAGYFKQDGIMLGTGFERANFRINSDHNIGKFFTFGQTLLVAYGNQNQEPSAGGRTQLANIIRMTPYIPVTDPNQLGGYRGPSTGPDATDPQNPVRAALQDLSNNKNVRLLGSVFLEAAIMPWLKYRLNVGVDYNSSRLYQYSPIYNEGANSRPLTNLLDRRGTYVSPVVTNLLTFDKMFGKHQVNAIAAIETQSFNSRNLTLRGNSTSTVIKELSGLTDLSSNQLGTDPNPLDEALLYSYIGRLNYEYAGKYLVSGSVRYDQASHFAPGKKSGTFPSIGLGWRISEEGFLKDNPLIAELKIRGSYGSLGNIPGNYLWQSIITSGTAANFAGGSSAQGAYFNQLGNPNLEWEITKMTNIGLDLGLLSNRITFTAEYYSRRSENLILNVPLVPSQGFSNSPIANIGDMTNSGLEFQLGYNKSQGDFKWNVSANLSTVKNTVNKLSTANSTIQSGNNADYGGFDITRTEAGHPVQSFYGWVTDGIFQSEAEVSAAPTQTSGKLEEPGKRTAPGDIRFKDLNNDGVINAADRTYLGSFLPDFLYGLNLSANYKNFDLTLFFQGSQGNKIYNGTKVITQGMLRLFNAGTDVLNAWTPDNSNTNIPRAVSGDPNGNTRTSDRFVEDGSYLRLKNISLGYAVPAASLQSFTKGTLSNARIYVSAQNLLTFTKYTAYDPEIGSRFGNQLTSGIDYGQYPAARTVIVGLQLGF
jgi:TonB-dependent starch-binding outer membrane protein SusC